MQEKASATGRHTRFCVKKVPRKGVHCKSRMNRCKFKRSKWKRARRGTNVGSDGRVKMER